MCKIQLGGVKLILKSLASTWRLNINRRVKEALRESDVVVCATTEYAQLVEIAIGKNHHSHLCYLPENCIDKLYELNNKKFDGEKINLIYIGRLDEGKAPFIILEALAQVGDKNLFHLDMVGGGPLLSRSKDYVKANDLMGIVEFHGRLERLQVIKMLEDAHLMVLPSLYDANTTVIWEAMSHSVPTLCLDHCGMHDTVKEGTGIKIPVTTYADIVNKITKVLQGIAERPECLKTMAEYLLEHRKEYTWERRLERFEEFYTLAEQQFSKRKKAK